MKRRRFLSPCLVRRAVFWGLLLAVSAAGWAAPARDMRVVIDVSGSMKKTDPDNLRAPALRLLTELLRDGTRAGVWTFGQWTNMLVKHGEVDANWKELAHRESAGINSVALFTDIGQALDEASRSWKKPDPEQQRALILLTDGRVDISKDPAKNTTARQHLLGPMLDRFKELGIRLYPVGLSDNVDAALLEMLAAETQGLFQTARSADDLYSIFINILEESTQTNTLPIREGGFEVDTSVEELNIVVFRARAQQRIALEDPAGAELDKDASRKGLRWHEEAGYAVITIPEPEPGRWQILTHPHPDNRVFVVSDLRVEAGEVPAELYAGEEIGLQLDIADGDRPLADRKLLGLIETQAALEHENGETKVFEMQPAADGARSGRFAGRAILHHEAGLVSVLLTAEGPTFHRSVRRIARLGEPLVKAEWKGPSHTGTAGTMELRSAAGDPGEAAPVTATVLWEGPGVTRSGFETRLPAGGKQSVLFAPEHDGRYTANVAARTVAPSGRPVVVHLPAVTVDVVPKPAEQPEPPPRILIPAPEPPRLPPVAAGSPAGFPGALDTRWLLGAGGVNLFLVLAALVYCRRVSRRDSKRMQQRLAALESDDGEPAESAQGLSG